MTAREDPKGSMLGADPRGTARGGGSMSFGHGGERPPAAEPAGPGAEAGGPLEQVGVVCFGEYSPHPRTSVCFQHPLGKEENLNLSLLKKETRAHRRQMHVTVKTV